MVFRFLLALVLVVGVSPLAMADEILFTAISTTFNSPIGIDYHEASGQVVMSVNYNAGGTPYNFELVAQDGSRTQFSPITGLTDEIKIATARTGNPQGIAPGTSFTGNGIDGQIVKISPDGSSVSLFADLAGAGNGLMRGSLYVDQSGVAGGDVIAVTTGGEVWRITSAGVATKLNDVNTHLEGVLTVPDDISKYGPIAGTIIAGAEAQGLLYSFDPDTGAFTTYALGVNVEDIDFITGTENFFGVNFGTGRLLGAPASEFAAYAGDILLTQEFPVGGTSGLYTLTWNGTTLAATAFTVAAGSAAVGQWEHVTFAPAGIVEIPPTTVPEPGTVVLLSTGLAALFASKLRRKKS